MSPNRTVNSICGRPLPGKGKRRDRTSRVVGCPSVRPLMQRWYAAGLYVSSADWVRITSACLMHGGIVWLSQPRLADCCAENRPTAQGLSTS
jgi:hypothetical protein